MMRIVSLSVTRIFGTASTKNDSKYNPFQNRQKSIIHYFSRSGYDSGVSRDTVFFYPLDRTPSNQLMTAVNDIASFA